MSTVPHKEVSTKYRSVSRLLHPPQQVFVGCSLGALGVPMCYEASRRRLAEEQKQLWQERQRAYCEDNDPGSHGRHNCPNIPYNYCKKYGHIAPECPNLMRKRPASTSQDLSKRPSVFFEPKVPKYHQPAPNLWARSCEKGQRKGPAAQEGFPSYHCLRMSMANAIA